MANIVYKGTTINFNADRLNLTDMWRASGGDLSKKPAEWLRQDGTKQYIECLTEMVGPGHHLIETLGGRFGATWAHWQVGMAYAKYLSPEFHLFCNEVVRGHFAETPTKNPAKEVKHSDPAIARIDRVEAHANRLFEEGLITKTMSLDAVSIAIKKELGYDFTAIPALEYRTSATLPSVVTIVTPTNVEDFPYSAYEAGQKCKQEFDTYRTLQHEVLRKRRLAQLSGYGNAFAAVMRELRLHPHEANDYVPDEEMIENSKAYVLEVPNTKSVRKNGTITTKVVFHAQFNDDAVELVRQELRKRINDMQRVQQTAQSSN